jgi:hypothetical protein
MRRIRNAFRAYDEGEAGPANPASDQRCSFVRLEPVSNFEVEPNPSGKRETGSDTNHVGDTSGSPRVGAMGGGDSGSRVVWVAAIASATDSS